MIFIPKKRLYETFKPEQDQLVDFYTSMGGDKIYGNFLQYLNMSKNWLFFGNTNDFVVISKVNTNLYHIKYIYSKTSNIKNILKELLSFSNNRNWNIYGFVPFTSYTLSIYSGWDTVDTKNLKNIVKKISKYESYYLSVVTPDGGLKINGKEGTKKLFFICNTYFLKNEYLSTLSENTSLENLLTYSKNLKKTIKLKKL